MKVYLKKDHILVTSERAINFIGQICGVGKRAKGAAWFPFLFVRSEAHINPVLVNHERIHFRQQLETLFLGSLIFNTAEKLYARIFLRKSRFDAYLWKSAEQEAYINQDNLNYLKSRPLWNQFRYVSNKRKITIPAPGEVVIE